MSESSELEDDGIMERPAGGQNHDRHEHDTSRNESRAGTSTNSASNSTSPSPSRGSSKGKGRLVDVDLASTIMEEPPESLARLHPRHDFEEDEEDDPPLPFQPFRSTSRPQRYSAFLPMETDEATQMLHPRPESRAESVPPTVILPTEEAPKHDAFWASAFIISHCAMIAAFVLVWFQTSTPKTPLGDTIYSVIRASTNMLLWDTLLAIVISLLLLSLLRNYVRPLVFSMLVIVPVLLATFSLYPFISSFHGAAHGDTVQDRLMRWFSIVPAIMAVFWTWSVIHNRHSLDKAIQILEFSVKILSASPYLIILGFAALGTVVVVSWTWLLMFERVFLSGHLSSSTKSFILSANSWWLGAFFVLQLLWALSVIAGVQRATTAAVVSQWYFHRLASPQPSSAEVVKASFLHSTGALFGTICLSTFLSLLIRLPLIILPGRLSGLLGMCAYWIIPSGLATLTNPLTLTYSAIHSQPLGIGARGLQQLNFTSRTNPSNTMGREHFNGRNSSTSTLLPYRLAKLLLQATRWMASIALGFGGWVRVAHSMKIDGVRGSMYAYVVALMAGTIGYAVLGAIENVVGAVLDAGVVCWASESAGGRGEARFCREAGELFGGEGEGDVLRERQVGMV